MGSLLLFVQSRIRRRRRLENSLADGFETFPYHVNRGANRTLMRVSQFFLEPADALQSVLLTSQCRIVLANG